MDRGTTWEDFRLTPQITPCIWIDADPREARDHYFAIFDAAAEVFAMPGPDAEGRVRRHRLNRSGGQK
ncbi:MAG: hypothetical protein ACSLFF_07325 [Solirubrobacterales bacterium]